MGASWYGHLEIVRTLLEKGANIEAKNNVRTLTIVEMMMMMVMMAVKMMMNNDDYDDDHNDYDNG